MSGQVVRFLGGEAAHRGFFGGRGGSRSRGVAVVVVVAGGLVGTPLLGWPALAIALVTAAITLVVTARTHNGSMLQRRRRRRRWRARRRLGTDQFTPFDPARWAHLKDELTMATTGTAKTAAERELAGMRAMPDGADGMGWLQSGPGRTGIAWHTPAGEQPYLSVAFAVAGQLRGIESDSVLAAGGIAWGRFLADRAASSSLIGGVQPVTRVLPVDTARHEAWAQDSIDTDTAGGVPVSAVASYAEVIRRTGHNAMVQRHYVVISWPLTAQFMETAAKFGDGRDGWRALMEREVDAVTRGLEQARLGAGRGGVAALTARQTAALMLHQQDPSQPVDAVRQVDPAAPGVASHDEYAAHVVEATDPETGQQQQWWHRTAAITAEGLSTGGRGQMWVMGLLTSAQLDCIRTVTFHLRLVPALHAKAAARRDLTRDRSSAITTSRTGRIADDETTTAARAAGQRVRDLSSGSQHHGVEWAGFITVTARDRAGLQQACRRLAETCSVSMGVERLQWLDSFQAAASGTTWPISRGLAPGRTSFSARAYGTLAGRGDKEAL